MNLNQKTDALIVIDFQNDFALSDGALYVKDSIDVAESIAAMCSKFKNLFFTQDNHPMKHRSFASSHDKNPFDVIEMYGHNQILWPDHCINNSLGCEIVEELWHERDRARAIIRKGMNPNVDSYSAFRENFGPDDKRATTGFAGMLHQLGLKRLFFAGLARDYCVRFSAEDAVAEGFESFVIDDLTKSVDTSPEAVAKTTTALKEAGVKLINYRDMT
jgi:nicotinamidase/pyrazinamidase